VFSTTFRYSLISLVELAQDDRTLKTRQIASKFGLSPHYLSVVLRDLRRLGLVESIKGNCGGYRLIQEANQINVLQLYRSLAGSDEPGAAGVASPPLSPADAWLANMSERWNKELAETTLPDLYRHLH
jgi:Rrf2 family protein